MNAVDTNILFYAQDPRDPLKQSTASSLIWSLPNGILFWQVICEFIASARKLEPFGYDCEKAFHDVRELGRSWDTVFPDWATLDGAMELTSRQSISFWDASIISECLLNGVVRLYSEDLDTHDGIDGLEIINPFRNP